MTTMTRYRAAACEACGNHTVMTASGVCHTCICQTYPGPRRRYEIAIIYAAGIAIAAAFVLVVLTGHVRADGRTIVSTNWCFDSITAERVGCPTAPDKVCNIGHMPDGKGGCLAPLQLDSSGKVLCIDNGCLAPQGQGTARCVNGLPDKNGGCSQRVQILPDTPPAGCVNGLPDGQGGCLKQSGIGSSGGLRVQIAPDDRSAALVIRTRDKKSVMVRGLNMGACTATAAELSKSPDVEFAECFR